MATRDFKSRDAEPKIRDEDLPNKELLGAQALPPVTDINMNASRSQYRPREGVHLAEAGEVVLDNWTGKVDGKRTRVFRGTPVGDLPPAVRKALSDTGIKTGKITYEELGLRPAGTGPGARILGVKEG